MAYSSELKTILLVDDFEPFRLLICSMLQGAGFQVCGEASDGLGAVQKAKELRPSLILLDICLPKLNGIEAAKRMLDISPEFRVLFLSQETDADVVQQALSVGALGYVHKSRVQKELLTAVESTLRGQIFVSSGRTGSGVRDELRVPVHNHGVI